MTSLQQDIWLTLNKLCNENTRLAEEKGKNPKGRFERQG
jgi:hypothetical protein